MSKRVLELLVAVLAGSTAELDRHRLLAPKWLGLYQSKVPERAHDLNRTDDVTIKVCQLVGWDPIFPMNPGANGLYRKTREEIGVNSEPKNVACSAISRIPIASNLDGIFLLKHRIENLLLGKPRREGRPSA
jgi:hypothetical protein